MSHHTAWFEGATSAPIYNVKLTSITSIVESHKPLWESLFVIWLDCLNGTEDNINDYWY